MRKVIEADKWRSSTPSQRLFLWEDTPLAAWWHKQYDKWYNEVAKQSIYLPTDKSGAKTRLNALMQFRQRVIDSDELPYLGEA